MSELAKLLGVTNPTAYRYAHLYDMAIKGKNSDKLSLEIFRAYRGTVTMEQLAVKFHLQRQSIRYHLWKVIHALNDKKHKKLRWPLPQKLNHLKILHLLDEQPDLFEYPEKIAKVTNLTLTAVEEYLQYAYQKRTAKHET